MTKSEKVRRKKKPQQQQHHHKDQAGGANLQKHLTQMVFKCGRCSFVNCKAKNDLLNQRGKGVNRTMKRTQHTIHPRPNLVGVVKLIQLKGFGKMRRAPVTKASFVQHDALLEGVLVVHLGPLAHKQHIIEEKEASLVLVLGGLLLFVLDLKGRKKHEIQKSPQKHHTPQWHWLRE